MCFNSDYDWTAEVYEESEGPSQAKIKCDECRQFIHHGEWRYHVYMRENELCRICEDDCSPDFEEDYDCENEHSYGEKFDYDCCERCYRLRKAIRAVEEEEGCHGTEAEPSFGEMHGEVYDWGHYADEMRKLGLHEEAALVPPPDPDDVFEELESEYDWANEFGKNDFVDVDLGGEG